MKIGNTTAPRAWLAAMTFAVAALPSAASACSVGEVRALFEYDGRTQIILDVEAAMARAQAAQGVIPVEAAEEISAKARVELVPEEAFDEAYAETRHRMVALLRVWRESLNPVGDQYVHYGATTVDIYGSATVIQIDRALGELDACLVETINTMSAMASDHLETPMIGRTLGQHAQPITFAKKISTWIDEYSRHRDRIAQLRARLGRSAILKGAVGNYSGLGEYAIEVEAVFASELGLAQPYPADWNGTRDVFAEAGLLLGLIARSHQRIGQELFLLQGTDIAEVREAERAGVVGSSSMPHKRNPRTPEALVHAGRTIPRLGEVMADDVVNLFERDNTSRMTPVIEDILVQSVNAARLLNGLLAGLEVDTEQMRANIDRTRGFAMSQRIAFALSEHMPREEAEALVKQVIADALAADTDFMTVLTNEPLVTQHLSTEEIAELLDPERIEQPAIEQVIRTLGLANTRRF